MWRKLFTYPFTLTHHLCSFFLMKIERSHLSPIFFVIAFTSIITLRIVSESLLSSTVTSNPHASSFFSLSRFMVYEFMHFYFLMACVLLFLFVCFTRILRYSHSSTLKLLLVGLGAFILLPPVIDTTLFSGYDIRSYYEFYGLRDLLVHFFTFMSHEPLLGTTPGQRIVIALSLLLLIPFSRAILARRSLSRFQIVMRTILFLLCVYLVFYMAATAPSLFVLASSALTGGIASGEIYMISSAHIAQFFFGPLISPPTLAQPAITAVSHFKMSLIFFVLSCILLGTILILYTRQIFCTLVANMRPAQTLYHCALLLFGILVAVLVRGYGLDLSFFNVLIIAALLLCVVFAWLGSVVINDLYDVDIDTISNTDRPLISRVISRDHYLQLGVYLIILSSAVALFINLYVGLLIIGYHALSLVYSVPPLRLKQYPLIATATASFASLLIIFAGYALTSPTQTTLHFPQSLGWLIFISLTFCLPIKDLKDIDGDHADGVATLPTLLGAYRARMVIATSVFVSYVSSVFVFRDFSLFIPALICGSASFAVIMWRSKHVPPQGSPQLLAPLYQKTPPEGERFAFHRQNLLLLLVVIGLVYCAYFSGRISF